MQLCSQNDNIEPPNNIHVGAYMFQSSLLGWERAGLH